MYDKERVASAHLCALPGAVNIYHVRRAHQPAFTYRLRTIIELSLATYRLRLT